MAGRPSISETDKLLMKYLQNPPVQRFYQGGGLPIPITPVPTNPDANRPIDPPKAQKYEGSQRKTIATLRMLSKVMKALGMGKEIWSILTAPPPPNPGGAPGGTPPFIMNFGANTGGTEGIDENTEKAISIAGSIAASMAKTAGIEIGAQAINTGVGAVFAA